MRYRVAPKSYQRQLSWPVVWFMRRLLLFRRKSIKKAFKVASIVLRKNSSSVVLTFIPKYYSLLLGIKLYYYTTGLSARRFQVVGHQESGSLF